MATRVTPAAALLALCALALPAAAADVDVRWKAIYTSNRPGVNSSFFYDPRDVSRPSDGVLEHAGEFEAVYYLPAERVLDGRKVNLVAPVYFIRAADGRWLIERF